MPKLKFVIEGIQDGFILWVVIPLGILCTHAPLTCTPCRNTLKLWTNISPKKFLHVGCRVHLIPLQSLIFTSAPLVLCLKNNSIQQMARLPPPPDKVDCILHLLQFWSRKSTCTRRELESLIPSITLVMSLFLVALSSVG